MIHGVEIIKIVTHNDERGFFREIMTKTNEIKQISHSLSHTGVLKAWHAHKYQTQWNYVVNGLISVSLHDLREDSPTYRKTLTFLCGDNQKSVNYKFPPGVAHGYKCINGPMNIIYMTSGNYDLKDEIRIPHDDSKINFDWGKINTE